MVTTKRDYHTCCFTFFLFISSVTYTLDSFHSTIDIDTTTRRSKKSIFFKFLEFVWLFLIFNYEVEEKLFDSSPSCFGNFSSVDMKWWNSREEEGKEEEDKVKEVEVEK